MTSNVSEKQDKASAKFDTFLAKVVDLPAAPQILPRLLEAMKQDDADLERVMDLITVDPGLTAKVLQVANSAFFGPTIKINSIFQAIQQLGSRKLYCIVTAGAGRDLFTFPYQSSGAPQADPWRHAVMTAFACQFIADSIGADAPTMFTAGLLHDVGRIPLLLTFKEEYWNFLQEESRKPEPENIETEISRFGVDHARLGGRLLQRWKFSREIVSSVSAHHAPLQLNDPELRLFPACVNLGEMLSYCDGNTDPQEFLARNSVQQAMDLLHQTPQDLCCYRELIDRNMDFIEAMCQSK